MSLIIPIVCALGGLGAGVVGTLLIKKNSGESGNLVKENRRLTADLEYYEDLAKRNSNHCDRLYSEIKEQRKNFKKLSSAASSKEVKYVSKSLDQNKFSGEKLYLHFESSFEKNIDRMKEELAEIAGENNIELYLTVQVIGSWKKHLKSKGWMWTSPDANKTHVPSNHYRSSWVFRGGVEKVIEEIKAYLSDPYWGVCDEEGKPCLPNAPIIFNCQVRLSKGAMIKPDVKIVEVAVIDREVSIIEKPIYIERVVYKNETETPSVDGDLQDMIQAQIEVELAMRDKKIRKKIAT